MTSMRRAGFLSLMTITFWAMTNVILKYFVEEHQITTTVTVCEMLFITGIVLLSIAGKGENSLKTILSARSWLYGIFQILKNLTMVAAFFFVAATEANLIINIEIIISILLSWALLHRKPLKSDYVSITLILFGIITIIAHLDSSVRVPAALLLFFSGFCTSIRTIIAEIHPENKAQMTIKDRCRVTGFVIIVTSITFIAVLMALSFIVQYLPQEIQSSAIIVKTIPSKAEFLYSYNLIAATVVGIFVFAPSMYFYFYAAKVAQNEVFMMFRSFQALIVFGLEYLFSIHTNLSISDISTQDMLAGAIIIFGALSMIVSRRTAARNKRAEKRSETTTPLPTTKETTPPPPVVETIEEEYEYIYEEVPIEEEITVKKPRKEEPKQEKSVEDILDELLAEAEKEEEKKHKNKDYKVANKHHPIKRNKTYNDKKKQPNKK